MLSSKPKNSFVVGDFNYSSIDWELELSTKSEDELSGEWNFMEMINDLFVTQHCKQFTQYREGQAPTIEDLLLGNDRRSAIPEPCWEE